MNDFEEPERNKEILEAWLVERMSFVKLGKRYDLSPPRIKTIIARQVNKLRRENERLKNIVDHHAEMKSYIETHVDETVDSHGLPLLSVLYLDLSTRSANGLAAAGIKNLNEVLDLSDSDLLRLPNLGRRSLNELRECCERHFGFSRIPMNASLRWKNLAAA